MVAPIVSTWALFQSLRRMGRRRPADFHAGHRLGPRGERRNLLHGGWPEPHVGPPRGGHGRAHRPLLPLVSARTRGARPLLRLSHRVHGLDAGRRVLRPPDIALYLLGTHEHHLVLPDRLLVGQGRLELRRDQGHPHHGQRRPRHARGIFALRRRGGRVAALPTRPHAGHREPDIARRIPVDHPGRGDEERAVALPHLAAERHGSAHAHQRVPALGHHGEGGHLSLVTLLPHPRRAPRLGLRGHGLRHDDDDSGRPAVPARV